MSNDLELLKKEMINKNQHYFDDLFLKINKNYYSTDLFIFLLENINYDIFRLKHVPKEFINYKLLKVAIKQHPLNFNHVPNRHHCFKLTWYCLKKHQNNHAYYVTINNLKKYKFLTKTIEAFNPTQDEVGLELYNFIQNDRQKYKAIRKAL